jgi:glutamine synthetase
LPHLFSSGWHLHQSLVKRRGGGNAFTGNARDGLSATGLHYLAGLLADAEAGAAFATPTVNGYRRYRPYTLAPDRAIWARDNRGCMIRVLGQPGQDDTRLENRIGEPAANPYLYVASQIYAGLDGIAERRDPGPSADTPYETKALMLPSDLGQALSALRASKTFKHAFGASFVDYYTHLKEAELARFKSEAGEAVDGTDVTAWEQNEYFDLF